LCGTDYCPRKLLHISSRRYHSMQRAATFQRDSTGRESSVCAPFLSRAAAPCPRCAREHHRHPALDCIPYLPLGATSSYPEPAAERRERPPQLLMMNRALRIHCPIVSIGTYAGSLARSYYRDFAMSGRAIACAHTASTRSVLHHVGRERVPRPLDGLLI
jgi:hypothetical protein